MESCRYSDFSLDLHRRAVRDRIPINGTIEISRRCPLRCTHCYNNLPLGDAEARREELTLDEHRRIIDEIADAGCLWLLYTGGEVFARPDFLDIYGHARRKGLLITIFTNGTLITEAIADALAECPPFVIEITLYGATAETFDRITGVRGSRARALRGIDLLRARGLRLRLKTVAMEANRGEIDAMRRFAEERGIDFRFDAMINPRLDGSQAPLAVRLSPEEVVALDVGDRRRLEEWKRFDERFHGPVHETGQTPLLYHCGAGLTAFSVDPFGRLSVCGLSYRDSYDLRHGSFREGWSEALSRIRARRVTRRTRCIACGIKAMCGMCPANGELEGGDPEAPVDFLCRVAHLRAFAFGIRVAPHGDCPYCAGGEHHDELRRTAMVLAGG
ncbi:MAG: radical SAM protein [Planctomycetes bacterium]|nr:radical SAM protein [Planctomycetota bacterium]